MPVERGSRDRGSKTVREWEASAAQHLTNPRLPPSAVPTAAASLQGRVLKGVHQLPVGKVGKVLVLQRILGLHSTAWAAGRRVVFLLVHSWVAADGTIGPLALTASPTCWPLASSMHTRQAQPVQHPVSATHRDALGWVVDEHFLQQVDAGRAQPGEDLPSSSAWGRAEGREVGARSSVKHRTGARFWARTATVAAPAGCGHGCLLPPAPPCSGSAGASWGTRASRAAWSRWARPPRSGSPAA